MMKHLSIHKPTSNIMKQDGSGSMTPTLALSALSDGAKRRESNVSGASSKVAS